MAAAAVARHPGAYLSADLTLGAAGMSIDVAWESTIGNPNVKIAIIDSGIEWDDGRLVNKAYLNAGELDRDRACPRTPTGTPCGGTGALAGYDCNGDGVFSVADYANDPRMTPDRRRRPVPATRRRG